MSEGPVRRDPASTRERTTRWVVDGDIPERSANSERERKTAPSPSICKRRVPFRMVPRVLRAGLSSLVVNC